MYSDLLLPETAIFVQQLYDFYNRSYLLYHNLEHTKRVVKHTGEIYSHYNLDQRSFFILLAAAWFHDAGQLMGDMAVHEETGVQIMRNFFSDKQLDQDIVDEIARCIMATKMPVAPATLLEKMICDADTWHLGTKDFQLLDSQVWQELELRLNTVIENKIEKSLQFLEAHRFYTTYCIDLLSAGKQENIQSLKATLQKEN